jgi:hypothetical protein
MKKLLAIMVLGLIFSGNANAKIITLKKCYGPNNTSSDSKKYQKFNSKKYQKNEYKINTSKGVIINLRKLNRINVNKQNKILKKKGDVYRVKTINKYPYIIIDLNENFVRAEMGGDEEEGQEYESILEIWIDLKEKTVKYKLLNLETSTYHKLIKIYQCE